MKTISLHEKYKRDKKMLEEALDASDVRNVSQAFDRIDQILGNLDQKLPAIDGPLEKARQSLAKMLGSKGIGAKVSKMLGGQDRTLKAVMDVQVQLVSLFQSLPNIMTVAGKNVKKAISQASDDSHLTTKSGDTRGVVTKNTIADILHNDPQSLSNLENLIQKALQPKSSFLSGNLINSKQATAELLQLHPQEFSDLSQRAGGAQLKVPISAEEADSLSDDEGDENTRSRAQEILTKLKKNPNAAKQVKQVVSTLKGLKKPDIDYILQGLDGDEEMQAFY